MPASSGPVERSIRVSRAKASDRVESVLRHADAALEKWFRRAKKQGAGVLRHRIDDLQAGLKKVSTGLEHLERDGQDAPTTRKAGAATVRKASSARKPKKAA